MNIFKQFFEAESYDDPKIQAIKDCDLLSIVLGQEKPTNSSDTVERVHLHDYTHSAFKFEFREM